MRYRTIDDLTSVMVFGKGFNTGQTCIAPDYLLCPQDGVQEFIDSFSKRIHKAYPTIANNPDYTSIINQNHFQRLQNYLVDATEKGAAITEINPADENLLEVRKIAPTIITNVSPSMLVMQEEIFGPLLPIVTYKTIDEAIRYINNHPRPLALYYFGYDKDEQQHVLQNTISGGAAINDMIIQVAQSSLPFGGSGASGMGRYHGHEGFLELSHHRGVVMKGKINNIRWVLPPYGRAIHKLVKKLFVK